MSMEKMEPPHDAGASMMKKDGSDRRGTKEFNGQGGKEPTPEEMRKVVKAISDSRYILTEPTLYVSLIMIAIEPSSKWRIMRWYALWLLSGALCVTQSAFGKFASVILGIYNLVAFPTKLPILIAIAQMKSLLIFLRVLEAIQQGKVLFEHLGSSFASKYCLLYHDLRKVHLVQSMEEHQKLFRKAVGDVFVAFSGLFGSMLVLHKVKPLIMDDSVATVSAISMEFFRRQYPRILLRSYLGAFRLWGVLMVMDTVHRAHLLYYGIVAPSAFDHPYQAQGVGEFFSKRWDLAIGRSLGDLFFKPLAKRGHRGIGEFATFNASALLHVYLVHILGGGTKDQALTMLFFMTQLGLIQMERFLRLRGHGYFHVQLLLLGPLFYEPLFKLLPPI